MPPRARAVKPPVTGTARIPKPSQGWYRDPANPGVKYRRVTTILDQGVPTDGLKFWYALTVADCAMANLPYLVKASMSTTASTEARDWMKRSPTQKKDERAELGSAVHKAVEATILESPIPVTEDPEIDACLARFVEFVADWEIEFTASEMVVANDEQHYAGTLDAMFTSPKIVASLVAQGLLPTDADPSMELMMDTKTGGDICWAGGRGQQPGECIRVRPSEFKQCPGHPHPIKGVYESAGMQMSAYRACNRAWMRNGDTVPLPPTHPIGIVLHLRPSGYLPVPAKCGDDVYRYFQHAIVIAEWTAEFSKTVIAPPLTQPTTEGS